MKTSEIILDVVNAFSLSFKSLDLRTAAVRADNEWTNVITSIFFSNKSPEDVRTEQRKISADLRSISDGDFSFCFVGYPFNQLSQFFQQINQGRVTIGRKSINIRTKDNEGSNLFLDYGLVQICYRKGKLEEDFRYWA